jgi:hypothetical protein
MRLSPRFARVFKAKAAMNGMSIRDYSEEIARLARDGKPIQSIIEEKIEKRGGAIDFRL